MNATTILLTTALSFSFAGTTRAGTFGSVEPIANPAVIDTRPLRDQSLDVRTAFAEQLFQCGIVDQVINALSSSGAVTTINGLNTRFEVGAGGFALDADNTASFDFPANYVVLNFAAPPSIADSAALFETVGRIDPQIFATNTSGYTQYGRAYLSLQSDVPDAEFIAGYVQAAHEFGVEYTPVVNGEPSLFQGGAAFPGNNWTRNPQGQAYLARIPAQSHTALGQIRDFHLRITREVLKKLTQDNGHQDGDKRLREVTQFKCR